MASRPRRIEFSGRGATERKDLSHQLSTHRSTGNEGMAAGAGRRDELRREQDYVAVLYDRLDELREAAREQLRATRLSREGRTPQAQSERDAFAASYERRLAQLEAVDEGLCFGRLDRRVQRPGAGAGADVERLHIGRIGLSSDTQHTLLVDWRAPASEPFYRATAAHPLGVTRRRHLRTTQRSVLGYDDEVFDLDALSPDDRRRLSGEAALLAALAAHRSGRMRDVVATLQAEQDEVVRADREGVLVVQGGPGTGKTVVALHRAAYLLYTYRDRLASAGVLVVGPGSVFMRYVERVLPSLGETAVVLATPGELFPGITASADEPEQVAALKGDRAMVAVLAAAVHARQRLLEAEVTIRHEGRSLRLDPRVVKTARDNARGSGRLHNPARNVFTRQVLTSLARQAVGRHAWDEYDKRDRDETLLDLVRQPQVRALLDRLWPHLTAPRLLAELYADPAGAGLSRAQQALLHRDPAAGWTPADVPLLDEAAELIGETDPWARRVEREAEARSKRELRYAEDTLRASGAGGGLVDAATLAARYGGADRVGELADRALADRGWVFGHVVVDEAQELSWMTWRLLMRRCPSRSMTVVGDVAQAGAPWAARAWSDVLDEHAPGRWRSVELTVGYRTPAQVMALAEDILAAVAPELTAPQAVREGEHPPYAQQQVPDLPAATVRVVGQLRGADAGRIGVLVPGQGGSGSAVHAALQRAYPELVGMSTDDAVTVLRVAQSKGLEFDAVIVVDPVQIETGSPHGLGDLYVAVTRTTDRLAVLAPGPLPDVLRRLR